MDERVALWALPPGPQGKELFWKDMGVGDPVRGI